MGRRFPGYILGIAVLVGFASIASAAVSTGPIVSISTYPYVTEISLSVAISTLSWRVVPNKAFLAGESLVYVVKWGIIKGGTSSLEVQGIDAKKGRSAYHIVSEAHSAGIVDTFYKTHDRNETWLDVPSLTTLRYEKHIREGKFHVEEEIELDQEKHLYQDYSRRLDKGTTRYVEGPIPPFTLDVLGSLYYVRTLPLKVGQSYTFDVFDGKKIWPLVVKVQKREKVKVAAGKFMCLRVEPLLREPGIFVKKGKKLQVWMTDDAYHLPVLMRSEVVIGHVAAELTKYSLSPDTAVGPPAPTP